MSKDSLCSHRLQTKSVVGNLRDSSKEYYLENLNFYYETKAMMRYRVLHCLRHPNVSNNVVSLILFGSAMRAVLDF